MHELGKIMVVVGLLLAGIGLLVWAGVGKGWFGRLPGDIHITKGNVTFFFPIVTCIVVSIVLTVLFRIFGK